MTTEPRTSLTTGGRDQWATDVVHLCREEGFVPDLSLTAAVQHYLPNPNRGPSPPPPPTSPPPAHGVVTATVVPEHSSPVAGHGVSADGVTATGVVVADPAGGTVAPPVASVVQGTALDNNTPNTTTTKPFTLPHSLMASAYRLQLPCRVSHPTSGVEAKGRAEATVSPGPLTNCKASPWCFHGLQTLQSDAQTLHRCVAYLTGPCPSLLAATRPAAGETTTAADSEDAPSREACRVTPASVCLWRGLANLGNTCYFNAIVQLLFALGPLRRAILADGCETGGVEATRAGTAAVTSRAGKMKPTGDAAAVTPVCTNDPAVIDLESASELAQSGLKELFAQMAFFRGFTEQGAFPRSFVEYLALDTAVQQDAQEFMALLLDWLRCRCGPAVKAAVDATLGGTFMYDRRCGACGRSVKRAEPFLSLTVPVRPTLDEALTSFLTPEQVEGFTCDGCGAKATATSYQYLRTLPDVLLVHLNRFEFDLHTLQRRKVNTAMKCPSVLDLTSYEQQWHTARQQAVQDQPQLSAQSTQPPAAAATPATTADSSPPRHQLYELEGIVNHLGDTAHSGHYTYHGKVHAQGDQPASVWLDFNDANVTPLKPLTGSSLVSADAYILVYRRVPSQTCNGAARGRAGSADEAPPTASPGKQGPADGTSSALSSPMVGVHQTDPWASPSPAEFPQYLLDYVARLNWDVMNKRQLWRARREHMVRVLSSWVDTMNTVMAPSPATAKTAAKGWGGKTDATKAATAGEEPLYAIPTDYVLSLGRAFLPQFVDVDALNEPTREEVVDWTATAMPAPTVPAPWQPVSASAPLPGGVSLVASSTTSQPLTGTVVEKPITFPGRHYRAAELAARAAVNDGLPTDNLLVRELMSFLQNFQDAPLTFTCSHGLIAPWAPFKVFSQRALLAFHKFLCCAGIGGDTDDNSADLSHQDARSLSPSSALSASQETFLRTMAPFRLSAQSMCVPCVAATAAKVEQLAQNSRSDAQALEMLHEKGLSLDDAAPRQPAAPAEPVVQTAGTTTDGGGDVATPPPGSDVAGSGDDPVAPPAKASEEVYVYVSDDLTLAWETYVEAKRRWQNTIAPTEGFTAVFMLLRCGEQPVWDSAPGHHPGGDGAFGTCEPGVGAREGPSNDGNPLAMTDGHAGAREVNGSDDEPLSTVGSTVPSTTQNPLHGLIEALAPSAADTPDIAREEPEVSQQLLCPHGSIRPEATVRAVPERLRQYWLRRLPSILTAENQRGGLLLSSNSAWTIDSAKVERYLLPFLPVSTMKQRCPLCMVESVRLTTDRHARRLQQVQESRRFPTLWRGGHFTSPATLAQLRAALGAEVPENTTDEQLLQAHHPNRSFFKRSAEKEYRDYVKQWSTTVAAEVAAKEAEVRRLRPAAQKEMERDRLFASRVSTRGRGRGGQRGGGGGGAVHPSPSTAAGPDSAVGRLAAAEASLAALKSSLDTASPPMTRYYGCLPTWWVARWFTAVREATRFVQDGVAEEHDRIARMQSGISSTAIRERREAAHHKTTTSSRGGVPALTYAGWLCPHGGALLELAWLNPADPFWQGRRSKSAELIWHPEWVSQQQGEPAHATLHALPAAGQPAVEDPAAVPGMLGSATMATETDGSPSDLQSLNAQVDGHTWCWLPPMLIVPWEEFTAVVQAYGDEDLIQAVATLTPADSATAEKPPAAGGAAASADEKAPTDKATEAAVAPSPLTHPAMPLLVVEEKGVRRLQPSPCAEKCCESLLAAFEENRSYFTRGSLKLNLHIRKSKKNFYDATGTLVSPPPAATRDGSDGGIHHYTTLRQLRHILSDYIMREHGYLVPPEALEISRSRNKPLKCAPQTRPSSPPTSLTETDAKSPSPSSPSSPGAEAPTSAEEAPHTVPAEVDAGESTDRDAVGPSPVDGLEDATLFELGIQDGGALFVQLTDSVATACASTVNHVGQEEVWQTIPSELLQESVAAASGGGCGGHAAANAEAERRAFTESRLVGASPENAAETGVACPVCTFINAVGMVSCEMCESPLPR